MTDSGPTAHVGDWKLYDVINRRTAEYDASHLIPYLRQGSRVVDCGCGAGSITLDLAELVGPGEVVGFDLSQNGIDQATKLATERGLTNVQFLVADAMDPGLPTESFDGAHACAVLAYLADPGAALRVIYRMLKPGGVIGLREPQKAADWFTGPFSEAFGRFDSAMIGAWPTGDPLIGAKLPKLLKEAGFEHVQVMPSYSQVLSAANVARDQVRRLRPTEWGQRMIDRKLLTETELDEIEILANQWVDSGEGVAGFAEVTAVAWKPLR